MFEIERASKYEKKSIERWTVLVQIQSAFLRLIRLRIV